jgi:hypothetical protein
MAHSAGNTRTNDRVVGESLAVESLVPLSSGACSTHGRAAGLRGG